MTKLIMNKSRRPSVISSAAHSVTSNGVRSLLLSFLLSAFSLLLLSSCDCADCQEKVVPESQAFFNVTPPSLLFIVDIDPKKSVLKLTFNVTSSMDWKLIDPPPGFTFNIKEGKPGLTVVTVTLADFDEDDPVEVWVEASNGAQKPVELACQWPEDEEIDDRTGAGDPPGGSYVGAFWRANQTGERIIRIGNMNGDTQTQGAWSASVVWRDGRWGKDRIVLSNATLTELQTRGIYGATPDDAELHQVEGNAIAVSGTVDASHPDILFRIGLKKKFSESAACELKNPNYTTTWPARYALVKISYNDHKKSYYLFLRQGEGDDYLMRKEDFGGNGESWGAPKPRPDAVRFSPYNLTAETLNAQVLTQAQAATTMPGNRSKFVDFPTQCGAKFLSYGVNEYPRFAYAWHQGTEFILHSGTWPEPGAYVDLPIALETCPPGYHRPNDCSNWSSYHSFPTGEFRHSLFLNPGTGDYWTNEGENNHFVEGYYADGFFDRRQIMQPDKWWEPLGVSLNSKEIAHIGSLCFNVATNASLFFPADGYWSSSVGGQGFNGFWCVSNYAFMLFCMSDSPPYFIRCVRNE